MNLLEARAREMTSTPRIVVLGLDAASPALLRAWAADGTLPCLAGLLARGASGSIRGLDGFHVGSTWPSFYTGVNPARHGLHYGVQIRPGTCDYYAPADEGLVHHEAFWARLSRAGRRVAVLDVPLTRLDTSLNGMQVVEWGSHDAVYGFGAHPLTIEAEIWSRWGAHPAGTSCDAPGRRPEDYVRFREALIRGVEAKADLTRQILRSERWDCFLQVFTEGHCAGHQCWHLHDPAHPAHDPDVVRVTGDPIREVYRAMDAAVADVLREAGDATMLVLAAHGMGPWFGGQALLDRMLFALDAAAPRLPATSRRSARWSPMAALAWVWDRLPEPVRAGLRPVRKRLLPRRPARWMLTADPGRSRCFSVGNGFAVGAIRLNLAGREPRGLLSPGAEAEEFADRLAADLLAFVDERTGRPLVRRVLRTAALYEGEHLNALPDLLVEWDDRTPTGSAVVGDGVGATIRASSPRTGIIEGINTFGRTGEHRPEGLFVAVGAGIAPGPLATPVSLMDFAPTIEALLGLTPTPGDGRPIRALLPGAPGA
jgi:predicted AlkP superfamily phosphohydrolase/phosphomutase